MSDKTYNRTIQTALIVGVAVALFASWYIHVAKGVTLYFAGV